MDIFLLMRKESRLVAAVGSEQHDLRRGPNMVLHGSVEHLYL